VLGPHDRCQLAKCFRDQDLFPLVRQMKQIERLGLVGPANGRQDPASVAQRGQAILDQSLAAPLAADTGRDRWPGPARQITDENGFVAALSPSNSSLRYCSPPPSAAELTTIPMRSRSPTGVPLREAGLQGGHGPQGSPVPGKKAVHDARQ
jgi:hypothetical protein